MRSAIGIGIASALLVAGFGCQHDLTALQTDLDDNGPNLRKDAGASGSSGSSGAGGNGGSHDGTGGSDVQQMSGDPCLMSCDDPSTEAMNAGLMDCCYGIRKDKCGLNFGKDKVCLPPAAPGRPDDTCPGARKGAMQFAGCCRPDARCGFQADALGLGCVARDDLPTTLVGAAITSMPCDFPCMGDAQCSVAGSTYKCGPNPIADGPAHICVQTCERDADCPRDQVCALTNDKSENRVLAFCQAQLTDKAPGEVCSSADECAQGVCLMNATVCTQLCKFQSDCPSERPICYKAPIERPDGGMAQEFGACVPKDM